MAQTKNSLPTLSPEDRAAALEKAKAARAARAAAKRDIAEGKVSVEEALASEDPTFTRMPVAQFIAAVPGFGKVKTEKIMAELDIDAKKRLGGLGPRQRESLIAALAGSEE